MSIELILFFFIGFVKFNKFIVTDICFKYFVSFNIF